MRRADLIDLVHEAGGDVGALAIGDERDALVRLHVEAHADGVARAREEFRVHSLRNHTTSFNFCLTRATTDRGLSPFYC